MQPASDDSSPSPPRSAFGFLLDSAAGSGAAGAGAAAPSATELALRSAEAAVGRSSPNPPVGAVVTLADGTVVVGHTSPVGGPHAEVNALNQVAGRARGATLTVTLEPCAHHGRTPPCAERIVAEGVRRVVVGAIDPNPLVNGAGVRLLRDGGVEVDIANGAFAAASRARLRPFATAVLHQRPYVIWKLGTSLDGRVAIGSGESKYITGSAARRIVHQLRNACDAVLVGAATVLADDPALTVREIAGRDPLRVVVDSRLATLPSARVYAGGASAARVYTGAPAAAARAAFALLDVRTAPSASAAQVDLRAMLRDLASSALAVLCESPRLGTALFQAGLVDELWWFQAPVLLGADGAPSVAPLHLQSLADARRLSVIAHQACGDDMLTVLDCSGVAGSTD